MLPRIYSQLPKMCIQSFDLTGRKNGRKPRIMSSVTSRGVGIDWSWIEGTDILLSIHTHTHTPQIVTLLIKILLICVF